MRGGNSKINYSNALKILVSEVIFNGKPLDKVIQYFFKTNPGLEPFERRFIFQLFSFTIRHWVLIHEIYRKIFSSRNLDFHEIFHIQQILERYFQGLYVCNGQYEKKVLEAHNTLTQSSFIKQSYPEWLYNRLYAELGKDWEEISVNLNQSPQTVLRVNRLKTTTGELLSKMIQGGRDIFTIEGYPDAFQLARYFDIFKCEEFKNGLFEVQDAGSQKIAPFLDAEAGMRVIDACAGNGGKTLHLASLMKNKGRVIALDIASYKLETIKKRMKRAGAFNIETRIIDSSKVVKRLQNSADRLLLDVPCSGTGVLKRNPDIKYHLTPENLKVIHQTQSDILDKYSTMVASCGIMVYSTCSILPSENQQQVQSFLNRANGSFELMEEQTISPLEGYDGFYMAKLKRQN